MRNIVLFFALTLSLLTSCSRTIKGSDTMSEHTYAVDADVTAIKVGAAMTLRLVNSLSQGEMKISSNSNIHKHISVARRDDCVVVEIEDNKYRDVEITIYASSHQYNSVEAKGASKVFKESRMGDFDTYDVTLSGASIFVGDATVADEMNLDLSGASIAVINGSADECNATLSSGSSISGYTFACDDLNVDMSGASAVQMEVNSKIRGALSGASLITYKGSVESINVDISGASNVLKQN